MSETWIFKNANLDEDDMCPMTNIDFYVSEGTNSYWKNQLWKYIGRSDIGGGESHLGICTNSRSGIIYYEDKEGTVLNGAYKLTDGSYVYEMANYETESTISYAVFNFQTSPTGDLLTWLNKYATKQPSQLSIDLSTLSGWEALESGTYDITVKSKGGEVPSDASSSVSMTKEEEQLTDLTGTVWKWKENLTGLWGGVLKLSFHYKNSSTSYTTLGLDADDGEIWYRTSDYTYLWLYDDWTWESTVTDDMKCIYFTGGDYATNVEFIKYLQENMMDRIS